MKDPSRIVTASRVDEDVQYEAGLRPRTLDDYIGQERVRANLQVSIAATRQRREALDHVLLYGPPGLGKTTLAYVIGHELGVAVRATAGPVLERPGDLAAILTSLGEHEVLFIDEIHRMSPAIEEVLYPAMEDYELDIIIGQGPGARSIKVPLQKFTLIGATTRAGLLTSPLRSRFGIVHRLDFYNEVDLQEIVRRSARILNVPIVDGAAAELAKRSRGTPRIANRLLRRVRDFAQVKAEGTITEQVAADALKLLEVDEHGFDEVDRKLLRTIIDKFGGGPVGINSIAAAISEEKDAIEDIYEPFLIQIGFLDRTPQGPRGNGAGLQLLWIDCTRKGFVVKNAGYRPTKISGLATYVPPRLLTNKDLEKLVNTSDEWILQRTGIRERHIVDPGVATSDLATEAALKAIAQAGLTPARHRLHRRRHDDARHDVSEHGVPRPEQDRRRQRLGLRSRRRLLRVHLRADDGRAHGGGGHASARARHRRRRHVEHHRLHRSIDVRALRRRRGRGRREPGDRRLRHHRLRARSRRQRRPGAVHARGRQPAAGVARDRRSAAALREAGRAGGLQIRREENRRNLRARPGAQQPDAAPTSICSCRIRPIAASSCRRPSASGCRKKRSSSTSRSTATRPPARSPSRLPMPSRTAA